RRVLRSTDTLARLGGDEFGLILDTPSTEADALQVADNVRRALAQPFEIEGLSLHVGASVGISLFPEHGDNSEELLRHADIAMYQAKSARSGREIYARERDTNSRERLELVGQLRGALEGGQLELRFQPKAEAGSHRIVGAEALVRWRHPERGLLSPME